MAVPFPTFTTRKWAVLTSKLEKLLIGIKCVVINNNGSGGYAQYRSKNKDLIWLSIKTPL
jgi:hypothetical protein